MENPQELDAPIVAYFPLISDTFQKYKAPGKPPLHCIPSLLWTQMKSPGWDTWLNSSLSPERERDFLPFIFIHELANMVSALLVI